MSIRRLALGVALVLLAIIVGVSSQARAAAVCTPTSTVSGPYARDGAADACFQTANLCSFINSWNMTTLEVNGTAYTNQWVDSRTIAPLNGMYIIHYVGPYAWSHFEFGGTCSTTPPPTTPPPTTPPPTTPPPTTPPPTTPPPTTPPPTTPPPSGNTGWVSPTAQAAQSGGDGNGFQTSPTNAFADDSAYATDTDSGNGTSTSCTSTNKDRHAYYSYPISIPAGATINGIEVRLDSRADSTSGTPRHCVELSWNNGSSWTAAKQTGTLTTSMATRTLGSASDTWGRTWTTGELTSATLRVRITNVASSTSRDFFLDWIPVRVTYGGTTPPPTTPPPTTPPPTTPPPTTPPPTTPPPTTPPPGGTVWRVDANGNITKNGAIFHIHGGSWFGLQGRYEIASDSANPRGAPMEQYMGNVFWAPSGRTYDQDIAEFKAMGLNVIRLPLVHQTLDANDPQGRLYLKNDPSVQIANSRLALETIIKKLDAAGVYVLLDIHSCSNYVDWRKGRLDARPPYVDATRDNYDFKREDSSCAATNNPASVTRIQAYNETLWLQDLQTIAAFRTTLGVDNIMGIDIFNEPWDYTWAEWKTLTEHAYTTINAVNPNVLIFMQGISNTAHNQDGITGNEVSTPIGNTTVIPNWGENLAEAGANPPNIPKERLVFSPHAYGPSVFVGAQFMDPAQPQCAGLEADAAGDAKCNIVINPTLLATGWEASFGYLKSLGYGIVVGEFGGNWDWPGGAASLRDKNRWGYLTDKTTDAQWQTAFVAWLNSKGITDSIYWSVNPESGDTGGLYTTPYIAGSNESAWGTWGALDSRKVNLLKTLWK